MTQKTKLSSLYPFFIFLALFLGSGCYFMIQDVEYAFYQIPPAAAIIPALAFGVLSQYKKFRERIAILITVLLFSDVFMCYSIESLPIFVDGLLLL